MGKTNGFTLIELLIVVAIIAILAAIALPNFMEAQTRSKVARNKADMRTIALALEIYKVDSNRYPVDVQFYQSHPPEPSDPLWSPLNPLTSPVAYLTSLPHSGFVTKRGVYDGDRRIYTYKGEAWRANTAFLAMTLGGQTSHFWVLISVGPDLLTNCGEWMMYGENVLNQTGPVWGSGPGCLYDPTNGSRSWGDIVRVGP